MLEQFDSLPWGSSLPKDDPFSMVVGTNELEGGSASFINLIVFSVWIPRKRKRNREEKKISFFFEVSLYLE